MANGGCLSRSLVILNMLPLNHRKVIDLLCQLSHTVSPGLWRSGEAELLPSKRPPRPMKLEEFLTEGDNLEKEWLSSKAGSKAAGKEGREERWKIIWDLGKCFSCNAFQQRKELVDVNVKFSRAETNLFWSGVFSEGFVALNLTTIVS